jgi:hypothetical protein
MAPVNLKENIDRIEEAIVKLEEEVTLFKEEKEKEILRLEGCRIVYTGLREVYGDILPDSDGKSGHSQPMKCEKHDDHDAHHHDDTPPGVHKGEAQEELSLEDLYKKYRAM